MSKFRDWMHGKGRKLVMLVVTLAALGIVFHYFAVERDFRLGTDKPLRTVTPRPMEDTLIGGDSLSPAATALPEESVAPTSVPEIQEKNQSQEKEQNEKKELGSTEDEVIHLGFAGDICLDDTCAVMRHMKKKGSISKVISPELIKKMNSYDSMVINNEFCISKKGRPMSGKKYTFRSAPSNVKYLKELGIDVAGLANNHIYDYGKKAFLDTLKYLWRAGIQTVGAGKNKAEAKKPVYLEIKGKTIAIVAATRAEKYILTPEAGKKSPGVFRTYNSKQYAQAISKAKKKADYVIAYVHWGTEYSTELEDAQVKQAKEYINAGADAVIGAHTHCLQGVGYYKGAPIFYSLGNFWFNAKSLYTTVLEIDITTEGKLEARMLPCMQRGKETKLLTNTVEKKKFNRYINQISTNARLNKAGKVCKKK